MIAGSETRTSTTSLAFATLWASRLFSSPEIFPMSRSTTVTVALSSTTRKTRSGEINLDAM